MHESDPTLKTECPICGEDARYDFSGRDLMFDHHARHDYFQCTGCAAVFQHPMPGAAAIASFYPPDYSVYDEQGRIRRMGAFRRARLQRLCGYAHLDVAWPMRFLAVLLNPLFASPATPAYVEGGRMLDVGCGNGRYLTTMRTLGWQVQGVEFSDDGMRVCRAADLPVHHGDLHSARFPDAAFDLITVRHVIEHIPEPHPFMSELARILKPGGRLVIETPNSEALGRAWFGANWYANDVPRHLILFAPGNLARLAGRYGMHKLSLEMDTTPKIFLNSIDYVMHNRDKPSKKIGWRRILARCYTLIAKRLGRGDTMKMVLTKP